MTIAMTAAANPQDRRRSPRWSTQLPALIAAPSQPLTVHCTVVDMSAMGAQIQLEHTNRRVRSAEDLPDAIVLALPAENVEVCGSIRWRSGRRLGLCFSSPFAPSPRRMVS